jgi:outer membrane protein assembly factor BamB/TolA-binding protein
MLVRELIDRLESSGLLDHEIIEALRLQLEESGARVTPEAVAKLLVDNGHLTRFQATKVIGELRGEDAGPDPLAAADDSAGDLGLADESGSAPTDDPNTAIILDDDDDVPEAMLEDDDEVVAEAVPVDDQPVVAEAVAVGEMGSLAPHPVVPVGERKKPEKNVWDSFWIYGIAGLLVLLIGVGYGLIFVLGRQSADDFVEQGNNAYSSQNYAAARDIYTDFIDNYPGDKSVSKARVRIGISEIVLAKDSVGDAGLGLKKATEVLPTIEKEAAFEEERAQLAGLLVDIGSKIAEKADSLKAADEKQETLNQLKEWFVLIDNPVYMSSTLKQNLGPRITAIVETQSRVQRDIRRDRDLAKALTEMRAALDAKETKKAYDVRTELVRNYPRLTDQPQVSELVLEASAIQQDLVQSASTLPEVTTEAINTDQYKMVFLDNLTGQAIPELANRVVYFKVRGAVMAVSAETGKILWRRYVGNSNLNPPVPLGDSLSAGVLLSDGTREELQRVAENQIEWRSKIGEPFNVPVVDSGTVLVSTRSGLVLAIDAMTGDARWGRKLPQPLPVPPGKQPNSPFLYQPAEHSNLYVLSNSNGQCVQSYYLGHDLGTIAVPPIQLLGHLFVFENAGSDYCMVHVLAIDSQTGMLKKAQSSVRLNGVVTAPPEVQQRRMIVLTEFGQVTVFDVEPSAEVEKVRPVAQQVATYSTPTKTQMVVGRNEMWVTGTRIGRFDLQINTGKVIGDWVQNEGDRFIAKPLLVEGTLIHARELRGTDGVRITAARKDTGDSVWQNDVSVPISMVAADPKSKSIYAITAQAGLFKLSEGDLVDRTIVAPTEKPGGASVALNFDNPLDAGDGRRVMLNRASSEQVIVFDPNRERDKLRLVTLSLPRGRNSADAIIMAGGLLMPMDNGRIMLMNWESGMPLGSPFQPPTKPGETVQWTSPVPSPADPEQLLIGDSRSQLYRLRIGDQIRELSSTKVEQKFTGGAAATGGSWLAAASGSAGDTLVTYSTTTLEQTGQRMMGSPIVFGPVSADQVVLVQTSDGKLHRVDESAALLWSIDLPSGAPAATPRVVDGKLFVVGRDGWILKVDPADGQILGQVDVQQPLSGNPLMAGTQMLVPGAEGILFVVAKP